MYRIMMMLVMVLMGTGLSAPIRITGKVTGESEDGIPGAIVLLTSNQSASTTDASGNFSIEGTVGINSDMFPTNGHAISINQGIINGQH